MSSDSSAASTASSDFAHLHLHTQYSLLDGAIRVKDLCRAVKERGMSSVAMTDHGNMFGAVQFYKEAKSAGVKPIFGSELYVSENAAAEKSDRKNYHMILLAENEAGYANLQRLVSFGYLRGFYYHPRVDRQQLRDHAEGLIATSACLGGHIPRMITGGDMDGARERILEYKDIFAKGKFFLELQPNRRLEQEKVNTALAQFSEDLDVPLIAAGNCHYIDRDEAHAHEVLSCMGLGRSFDDPNRPRRDSQEYYIKSADEMLQYFSRYPSAYENACRVASMCNVELHLGDPELPEFQVPDQYNGDIDAYLRVVVVEGLEERFAELAAKGFHVDRDRYMERIEYELGIIIGMKFPGYFLIVWDFIRHAKSKGIPVGPGRGSGAGSLVAYALRITDLDPLQYNLLFERFLNPERVSMPDFDVDFCMDRREEVIRYVTEFYGADRVGQIATFHSLKARGLVRDVCRVMGVSVSEATDLAKRVPEGPKVSLSMCVADPAAMKKAIKADPEKAKTLAEPMAIAEAAAPLRQKASESPELGKILEVGVKLEGLYRHAGMHAAGVVIGNRDLWEHVPCFAADGRIVTQYTMSDVEQAGLVKFDFLGLKTLTVIQAAVRLVNGVRKDQGIEEPFDIDAIPMDDAGVYEMISRGDTTGVFQLESSGFKELLKKLKPDCFEDIIAAVALYRPGPLEGGMVDQFIECKHGRREIEYPHDLLTDILKETYGVFVYQEQVMQAGQILAGFSLGAADLMRRAMGKKKKAEMDRQRELFVKGCSECNDIPSEKSNEIFDLIDKFAGYGFNKSHSAAYGLITYQTAYLKHHYPVPFMAGLMTCDKDKSENVVKFVAEARTMGIEVLTPCVNQSEADFTVVIQADESQAIRFGLGAVRNVGSNAVDSVVAVRASDGAYSSVFDLCRRVDLRKVNRRTLEGLVHAGAFTSVAGEQHRAALIGALGQAIEQGQCSQRDRESGQKGLFDVGDGGSSIFEESYPDVDPWSQKELLAHERDALGFYLTGHPLDRYAQDIERHATGPISQLRKDMAGKEVTLGGVVCEYRMVNTKTGKSMCFFQLEDPMGRVEVVVFPKTYASVVDEETGQTFGEWMSQVGDAAVFVKGKLEVDLDDDGNVSRFKLLADGVHRITDIRKSHTRGILLDLPASSLTEARLDRLKTVVERFNGTCEVEMQVTVDRRYRATLALGEQYRVNTDDALIDELERLFEGPVARFVSVH